MGTGERFQLSLCDALHSTEVSGKLFYYAAGFAQVFGEELNEAEKNICTYAVPLRLYLWLRSCYLYSAGCVAAGGGRGGGRMLGELSVTGAKWHSSPLIKYFFFICESSNFSPLHFLALEF